MGDDNSSKICKAPNAPAAALKGSNAMAMRMSNVRRNSSVFGWLHFAEGSGI